MFAVHHAGYEGFLRAERPWRELAATLDAPRFFHAYDWYAAFFAHLHPRETPMGVIELQREGRCVGVFPYLLQRIRRFGLTLRVLTLPESPHLILSDVLLTDSQNAPESLRAIRNCLARARVGWHALRFPRVSEDSHALRFAGGLPSALVRPGGGSRYFDATEPFAGLSAQFSGRLRKTLKKGRKRLGELGAVEWLSIGPDDVRLPWAFERFLALEASGWKGQEGTGSAIALSRQVQNFYRDLTCASAAGLHIEINLLCLDGRPIAGQFASVCGTQRSIHKIAYDESFQSASPGTALMANTLERSCGEPPVERLSLVTDMPWMRDWNASRAAVYDIWVLKNTLWCALARTVVRIRQTLHPRRPAATAPDALNSASV